MMESEKKSADASIRLQACELLSSNASSSRFYRSVALETLLLGDQILDNDTLFQEILDEDGELGGVMCSTLGHCTVESVLQSGHLKTLCDHGQQHCDDHWTNHMARTCFLYCFAQALSRSSLTLGLQRMIDSGFIEYLVSRLECFKRRVEHNGRCRLCEIEQHFCRNSIMIFLPLIDDTLWKKHGVDIFALSLQLLLAAASQDSSSRADNEPWCKLLLEILVRGGISNQNRMSEVYGFDYPVALDQMQELCLKGMQTTCCIHCKYESEWHHLLLLILILRGGGGGDQGLSGGTNWTAPEA